MGDVLVQQAMGWQSEIKRDQFGLEIEKLMPGNITSKWQRDKTGRVTQHWVGNTNANAMMAPKRLRRYSWDVDMLKSLTDPMGESICFEHDKWNNLSKTTYSNGDVQLRNPDAVGNLFETENKKDRIYGKGGQLKKANGWEYFYDAEGNLIEKKKGLDVWRYEWNAAGMLQKVTRPDEAEVYFKYDALGRRIEKRYKKTITKWVWDGNKPLHEWKEFDAKEGTGDLITWIFEEEGFAPTAKIKGDKKYSIITDHLGTPCEMYTESGEKFWQGELDSFGKLRLEKGEIGSCPFRYQGQTFDADISLTYNRFRWYSQEDGIYISKDPIALEGGLKLYGYVKDPNGWIDVFGLESYPKPDHGAGKSSKQYGHARSEHGSQRNADELKGRARPKSQGGTGQPQGHFSDNRLIEEAFGKAPTTPGVHNVTVSQPSNVYHHDASTNTITTTTTTNVTVVISQRKGPVTAYPSIPESE